MRVYQVNTDTGPEALKATVGLIAKAIRHGSEHLPIRQYAAEIASRAEPRDFYGQLSALYGDFINRWRYVHDPLRKELLAVSGPVIYGQVLGFDIPPPGHGFGDCDDSTAALGAIAESVGLQTRIVTIATPQTRQLFSHVFPQIKIPKVGWVSADPVVHPRHGLGYTAPYKRIAIWDTNGRFIGARGLFPRQFKQAFKAMRDTGVQGFGDVESLNPGGKEQMSFSGLSFGDFEDYDLERYGLASSDTSAPEDWATHGLLEFGAYVDQPMPMINGDRLGLMMEYDENDYVGDIDGAPLVRTKMLEMDPQELSYCYRTGRPRRGAVALSDDGDVYQWTEYPGMGGFFSKLFKKAKKFVGGAVKKVVKGIGRGARKLIKKLPGGKYLVKIYDKVKRVAMKVAKPLMRIIGKVGKYVAPIAALIPGYGPVIAAALYKAGKITKLLKDFGVMTDKKGRPKFKSGKQAKAFNRALKKQAKRVKRKGPAHARRMIKGGKKHKIRMRDYGVDGVL